jgi:FixJ family two-component response regulator
MDGYAAKNRSKDGSMRHDDPTVFIVDDDVSIRESLKHLLECEGWNAETFASASEFLTASCPLSAPSCLVLDVSMPGINGLDLQKHITADRPGMPIVFITGYGSIPMSVRAMKAGALEFLTKPLTDEVFLAAIRQAIERSRALLGEQNALRALRDDYEALSNREKQVMILVVTGMLNKNVAGELGISEKTVKAHRGQVMQKMKAKSFADLVNMATRLRLGSSRPATAAVL